MKVVHCFICGKPQKENNKLWECDFGSFTAPVCKKCRGKDWTFNEETGLGRKKRRIIQE